MDDTDVTEPPAELVKDTEWESLRLNEFLSEEVLQQPVSILIAKASAAATHNGAGQHTWTFDPPICPKCEEAAASTANEAERIFENESITVVTVAQGKEVPTTSEHVQLSASKRPVRRTRKKNKVSGLAPVLYPCSVHALPMLCPCSAHALPMLCPCSAHALPMLCPCSVHALPMLCPCSAHALSMLSISFLPPLVWLVVSVG
jgi:hypothetical protein